MRLQISQRVVFKVVLHYNFQSPPRRLLRLTVVTELIGSCLIGLVHRYKLFRNRKQIVMKTHRARRMVVYIHLITVANKTQIEAMKTTACIYSYQQLSLCSIGGTVALFQFSFDFISYRQ